MANSLSKSAACVQEFMRERNLNFKVIELAASTRTANEAASAIGCSVGQIIKSILFRSIESNMPILVLASGLNRINEVAIAKELGRQIVKADAVFAREITGFAIGGIPPIGHKQVITTYIDADLLQYNEVWAAAGTPNAVFNLVASELPGLTDGKVIAIK